MYVGVLGIDFSNSILISVFLFSFYYYFVLYAGWCTHCLVLLFWLVLII